jgi:hypothetical protein
MKPTFLNYCKTTSLGLYFALLVAIAFTIYGYFESRGALCTGVTFVFGIALAFLGGYKEWKKRNTI